MPMPVLRRLAPLAALAGAAFAFVLPAQAHNAGHFFLPNGTCQQVGSFTDAPLVGADRTQLDLIPSTPNPPFDEYGASFASAQGSTPIFPGPCPG
jgi:hypothetical protein